VEYFVVIVKKKQEKSDKVNENDLYGRKGQYIKNFESICEMQINIEVG